MDDDLNLDIEGLDEEKKKGSGLMLYLIIGVLVLGIGGGAAFWFLGGSKNPAVAEQTADNETAANEIKADTANKKGKPIYVSLGKAMTINLSDSRGKTHYLQLKVALLVRDESLKTLVKQHTPLIKNDLIEMLSQKTYKELISPNAKIQLRQEALQVVSKVISKYNQTDKVEAVLFTDFVME